MSKVQNENTIISNLAQKLKTYFNNDTFTFERRGNSFVAYSNNTSKAVSNHRHENIEVTSNYWFNDFWIYVNLKFNDPSNKVNLFPQIFITISVFQGDQSDTEKNQLFRAEWDNYSENKVHPQPHWHINSKLKVNRELSEAISIVGEEFEGLFRGETQNIVNLDNFHFAMNGQWNNDKNNGHIHFLNDGDYLENWFLGLLNHIRTQLSYIE